MKKLILVSFLFFFFFISGTQKSLACYDDNGYYYDCYDQFDDLINSTYKLETFNYKGINYPIVDSTTLAYYGKEKYAKSFREFVPVDTVVKTEFSRFFLERKKVPYITYLYNGYHQSTLREQKPTENKKVYIEFILFFILFPVVTYFMCGDKKIGRFESYWIKNDFKFFFFSFLLALCFKFLLDDLTLAALKIKNSSVVDFLGSELMFGFSAYIIILSFLIWLFKGFEEFIFEKLPVIFLGAVLAGISFGITYEEIGYISLCFMLCSAFIFLPVILFLFSKILYLFKQKEKADE